MAFSFINHLLFNPAAAGGGTSSAFDSTGANFIAIPITYSFTSGSAIPSISDSLGNTWLNTSHPVPTDGGTVIFYAENPTVGVGHTVTITGSNKFPQGSIMWFSGAASSSALDQQNNGTFSSATSVQPGSITPSQDNEVLITVMCNYIDSSDVDRSISPGSFSITDQNGFHSAQLGTAAAYEIQTTATARNPTWSWTGSQLTGSAAIASFKAATASSRGLFLPSSLSGLGSGGSFFQDRLAS